MRTAVYVGCLAFTLGVLAATLPAGAADGPRWRAGAHVTELPFARSERAQSVWQAGACWSDCGAQCAWGQNACLKVDEQGLCLAWTDACDRFCLKQCRTSGGPLLSITD